jgi:hypothetical protein
MDCYKQVTTVLDHLYDQRTSSSYNPSVTGTSIVPASQDAAHLSQSEANDQVICSSSSFICGAGGNPAYCTSAFEAVCTLSPILFPLFISRGAPRQTV